MVRRLLPAVALVLSAAFAVPAAAQLPPYPYPVYPTPSVPAAPAQPTAPDQGTQSLQPAQPTQQPSQQTLLAPVTIRNQTDGVNSRRVTIVAAFCRGPKSCTGTAKLVKGGTTLGKASFTAAGKTTFKTPIKLKASVFRALHKAKGKRMKPTLTLTLADGQAFSHVITIQL